MKTLADQLREWEANEIEKKKDWCSKHDKACKKCESEMCVWNSKHKKEVSDNGRKAQSDIRE
jgi:ATP-dependent protease HslVU (ClpYQ) peptidase subunit